MNMFKKMKGKKIYQEKLLRIIDAYILSEEETQQLTDIKKEFSLTEKEITKIHKYGGGHVFKNITKDGVITKEEKIQLEKTLDYLNISIEDTIFDQEIFNKMYTIGLIEEGILPVVDNHDIDIIFKKDEVLHWGVPGELRKIKKTTKRINYAGPTASIKIMKGVKYRVGSMSIGTETSEHLVTEDSGPFYLTNQRIGFRGNKKNISIPYSKVDVFELNQNGITIFKQGRETPYIIGMIDYDVSCLIISKIINEL